MSTSQRGLEIIQHVIQAHYDLGEVALPHPLEAAHQRRHRKLTVETEQGKFLAKTYKIDPVVLDNLRFQHRLSDHLLGHGVPVARIQRARNGKGVVELDTWALELQAFVDAGAMNLNTKTLTAAADALGRFHKVCEEFPTPPRDERMWRFSEVPRESFAKLYDKARAETPGEAVDRHCNNIAVFLHEAGEALSLDKRSTFESGLIHGDWHGGNLMYRGNELAAIIDLEFAGYGCYLEDIAYAVSNLCIRTSANANKLKLRTDLLLDHYQISRSLSYAERVALYYAVGVKHVMTVSYQLIQNEDTVAGYTATEWMQRLDAQCTWLQDRAHAVRWGRE